MIIAGLVILMCGAVVILMLAMNDINKKTEYRLDTDTERGYYWGVFAEEDVTMI